MFRSAYAQFTLQPLFFSSIEQDEVSEDGEGGENCKVMVRSLLLAFRSLSTLEKTVESCTLRTDHVNCKLHVSFKCRHNVSKEFSLGLLEYESSKPMYDMNEVSLVILCQLRSSFGSVQQQVDDPGGTHAGVERQLPPKPGRGHHDCPQRQFQVEELH